MSATESIESQVDTPREPSGISKRTWLRLAAIVVLTVSLFVVADQMGLLADKRATLEKVRSLVTSFGAWGFVVFVIAYFLGELVHIPGIVFFTAAVMIWGRPIGGLAGYVGALVACSGVFVVIRRIGGQALLEIKSPFVQRMLKRLDLHPVRITFVLRAVLGNAPQLNYALALSNLRFRDYFIGSCLGLVIPISVQTLLVDVIVGYYFG